MCRPHFGSLFYWFFSVVFEDRHRSPVSWESVWTLRNFCVSTDFYFSSFPLFSSLFPPTLPSSLLSAVASWTIPHSDSSAVLREEQRSEGCGWAEWWIIGSEKAGVGTVCAFTHLLPALSSRRRALNGGQTQLELKIAHLFCFPSQQLSPFHRVINNNYSASFAKCPFALCVWEVLAQACGSVLQTYTLKAITRWKQDTLQLWRKAGSVSRRLL